MTPALKARFRNTVKSSTGSSRRCWRRTKSQPPATATTTDTVSSAQEGSGPVASLMAKTVPARVSIACREDGASHRVERSGRARGATHGVATSAAGTTGTLMRKTDPHQKASSSSPPTIGPSAAATTEMAPHTATARLRSRTSSKPMRIRARVAGIMHAAPTARIARAAMGAPTAGAKAASSDAAPNTTRPMRNSRRWPYRSPSVPAPSSRPHITSG